MLSPKYFCRKATEYDSIEKIAKYIHETDQYIYPRICKKPTDKYWQTFVDSCSKIQNNIYCINNISLLLYDDEIIGIACVIPCGKKLTIIDNIEIPEKIACDLAIVTDGYFTPLIEESKDYTGYNIVNFCIDENHREKGLGKLLMSHCLCEYGSHDIHLDVIASNEAAVKLYQNFGFFIENEYMGFSGNETNLLCYHMIRTKKV